MNIEIFARVIYVAPEVSHNRLSVTLQDGKPFVEYVLFDPSGVERNTFRKPFPEEFLRPGTMTALVEFWDGYAIIEHRHDTYEGVFGAHSMSHKATFVATEDSLYVLTNTPVPLGDNVRFGHGSESFFASIRRDYPAFVEIEVDNRTKAEVAAQLDSNASVGALEAQVDLLTEIVLSLLPPDDNEAQKLRKIMNDAGLQTLKTKQELRDEMRERKLLVRMKQLERRAKVLEAKQAAALIRAAQQDSAEVQAEIAALAAELANKQAAVAVLKERINAL